MTMTNLRGDYRLPRLPLISAFKNRPITLVFSPRLAIVRASNMGQNLRNRVTQNLRSSPFWKDSGAAMKPSKGGESCIFLSSALC